MLGSKQAEMLALDKEANVRRFMRALVGKRWYVYKMVNIPVSSSVSVSGR